MGAGRPETVTVVFTDVVGSTAWRSRVGDVVADTRTAELEQASRDVVESAGGTVVKSLGDGVMATFTSAVTALDAAAELQVIARRLAVGETSDCLRVGVSSGDMVRESGDWLGAAAIEASRLCADAAGGSVLVADATVRLSRGRSSHHLRLLGERTLRGFDEPLDVYELAAGEHRWLPRCRSRSSRRPAASSSDERPRPARAAALLDAAARWSGADRGCSSASPVLARRDWRRRSRRMRSTVDSRRCTDGVTKVSPRRTSRSSRPSTHGWRSVRTPPWRAPSVLAVLTWCTSGRRSRRGSS